MDPHPDGTEAPASGDGNTPEPAADGNAADGLITAKKGYDAAMQTTRKIRQRSLLDFLR